MQKYKICLRDLNYGDCNGSCNSIHLTKRGLKPYKIINCVYYSSPVLNQNPVQIQIPNQILLTEEIADQISKTKNDKNYDGDDYDINLKDDELSECETSIFD